jgi:hypothetical protein
VEFSVDKGMRPGGLDNRELALIVTFYKTSLARVEAHLPIRFV